MIRMESPRSRCFCSKFKRANSEDFVEVEDDENGMMVIKNKTIVLEDELASANKVKEELQTVRISLLMFFSVA